MFIARLDYAMTHLGWLGFLTAVYFAGIGLWLAQLIWRRNKAAVWQDRSEIYSEYRDLYQRALENQTELLEACEIHETSLLQRDAQLAVAKQKLQSAEAEIKDQQGAADKQAVGHQCMATSWSQQVAKLDAALSLTASDAQQANAALVQQIEECKRLTEELESTQVDVALRGMLVDDLCSLQIATAAELGQQLADAEARLSERPSRPADADDLTEIFGLSRRLEDQLNLAGVFRFDQIAAWTKPQQRKFEERLDIPGRIRDGRWVEFAKELSAADGGSASSKLAVAGSEATSYLRAVRSYGNVSLKVDASLGVVFDRRPSVVDDLTVVRGIGDVNEECLQKAGVYYLQQIADWDDSNVQAFNALLAFKGRIERERWVQQAQALLQSRLQVTQNQSPTDTTESVSLQADWPSRRAAA